MTRAQAVSNAVTGVLVLCAVLVTAAVVRRELLPARATASGPATAALGAYATEAPVVENWDEVVNTPGHWFGSPEAPVRIVEFSDFQCPFCAEARGALRTLRERHPQRVAIAYRHLPLDAIHPHARNAALAAECAGEQGRFEAYHDALFARQESIGHTPWSAFADEARVPDADAFASCMEAGRWSGRVDAHAALAAALDVTVTPTFVVNGRLLPGIRTAEELEHWMEIAEP